MLSFKPTFSLSSFTREVRWEVPANFQRTSLVARMVKHLPTMLETWVQSLGQEYLLEKEIATHSSVLAWKIPWMEEPGYSLQTTVHGVAKSQTRLSDFTFTFIKRLFNSSSLSAIRVVSSAYLKVIHISPSNLDSSLYFFQPTVCQGCISQFSSVQSLSGVQLFATP